MTKPRAGDKIINIDVFGFLGVRAKMALKEIKFTKMHGIGNDYVYINCFEEKVDDPGKLAVLMSPRHFSVGSDGVILICPSQKADAKMRMFNADGSEGKMCGNGIRCVGKYLYDNNIVKKDVITIDTLSGIKTLTITEKDGKAALIGVDMGAPEFEADKIPVIFSEEKIINKPVKIRGEEYKMTAVSMGNPHAVIFLGNVKDLNLNEIGPDFENFEIFPQRVNTEFVKVISERELEMRVYERGSGETLACGTGACACVAAAVENGICKKGEEIKVNLLGGSLLITYMQNGHIYMRGSAQKVYDGVFSYES